MRLALASPSQALSRGSSHHGGRWMPPCVACDRSAEGQTDSGVQSDDVTGQSGW